MTPTYTWKLENKKFCEGCIFYQVFDGDMDASHYCKLKYYFNVTTHSISAEERKRRPAKCIKELGQ